jgi:hypothetical protein
MSVLLTILVEPESLALGLWCWMMRRMNLIELMLVYIFFVDIYFQNSALIWKSVKQKHEEMKEVCIVSKWMNFLIK